MNAEHIIRDLGLESHPEGGWYKRSFTASTGDDDKASASAIYYLLEGDSWSTWHRIPQEELWLWHAGDPVVLEKKSGNENVRCILGADIKAGERPQILIPGLIWQRARSAGAWSLVTCVVTPEFVFEELEMTTDPA